MWYLCEKGMAAIGSQTQYQITADGVDFVENHLTDEHAALRAIAAVQIPERPENSVSSIHLLS
jgi:hypothetical protein